MKMVSFTPFPPGSFPYEQTVKGVTYKWPDVGLDIYEQSKVVSNFRKANGLDRSSLQETIDDINEYTCMRLGNDPRWCSDNGQQQASIPIAQNRGCGTCGK